MLVLSRKQNETIVLPELGISFEIVKVKGNVVRVGINAPDSIKILRGELDVASDRTDDNGAELLTIPFSQFHNSSDEVDSLPARRIAK